MGRKILGVTVNTSDQEMHEWNLRHCGRFGEVKSVALKLLLFTLPNTSKHRPVTIIEIYLILFHGYSIIFLAHTINVVGRLSGSVG